MAATIAFEVKSREQKKKKNSHQDSRWLPYVDYLNETKQKYRKSATAGATRELNSFTTRSARCVRKTQNTIHIIVSCMHAQFTFTGSNMQTTGRWVDNVTPLFLSLSMAFQSKLQYMFFTGDEIWDRDDQQQRCMRRSCRILTTKKKNVFTDPKSGILPH